jgi:hypothetical protein
MAIFVAACSSSAPKAKTAADSPSSAPDPNAQALELPESADISSLMTAIHAEMGDPSASDENLCALYIGNLAPNGAMKSVSIALGGQGRLNGWALCSSDLPEPTSLVPTVTQTALVEWSENEILVAHPAVEELDATTAQQVVDAVGAQSDQTYAILAINQESLHQPASHLFAAVETLSGGFAFIEWVVDPSLDLLR